MSKKGPEISGEQDAVIFDFEFESQKIHARKVLAEYDLTPYQNFEISRRYEAAAACTRLFFQNNTQYKPPGHGDISF